PGTANWHVRASRRNGGHAGGRRRATAPALLRSCGLARLECARAATRDDRALAHSLRQRLRTHAGGRGLGASHRIVEQQVAVSGRLPRDRPRQRARVVSAARVTRTFILSLAGNFRVTCNSALRVILRVCDFLLRGIAISGEKWMMEL